MALLEPTAEIVSKLKPIKSCCLERKYWNFSSTPISFSKIINGFLGIGGCSWAQISSTKFFSGVEMSNFLPYVANLASKPTRLPPGRFFFKNSATVGVSGWPSFIKVHKLGSNCFSACKK
uniref:Uncharacterized protein n=1 Tax=Romanomermis culicivorax TaxID=13658 RepID=A0A915I145_ROMCU